MRGLAFRFMVIGVISVLAGMVWGIYMAGAKDYTMAAAHAHLNLLGFVSFSIFAFYYHLVDGAALGAMPKVHFALSVLGLIIVVPGIVLSKQGTTEALAASGSILSALGMVCFLSVVLRGAKAR